MSLPTFPADQTVELTQRLYALVSHLDERRYEDLADLFLPDGRWLRQGRWLEGRAAILDGLAARPHNMRVRHVLSNVLVRGAGADEAEAEAYMTAYRQLDDQPPALFSLNVVKTRFRRVDGQWRIAEQQMLREFEFPAA